MWTPGVPSSASLRSGLFPPDHEDIPWPPPRSVTWPWTVWERLKISLSVSDVRERDQSSCGSCSIPTGPTCSTGRDPMTSPSQSIIEAAQAGGGWAWEEIYRSLAPKVRGYALSHGVTDPDDLVGEVFLQAVRNIGSFQGDESGFRAWLFTIAHRRVVDHRRRMGRGREDLAAEVPEPRSVAPSAEEATMDQLAGGWVMELLELLTEEQRQVVTLRVLAGLSLEETAAVMGRRPGAVKTCQQRAFATLRKKVEQTVSISAPSAITGLK